MILLRRDSERRHVQCEKHGIWLTFPPQAHPDPLADGFGVLTAFDELKLPPGGGTMPHPGNDAESVSYVLRGALAYEDSTGSSGVIHAGEFQHLITGSGIRHKETNASRTDRAHVFRISLSPSRIGLDRSHEHKRFVAALRHNVLCAVASRDGRKGSLRVHQDAMIFSGVLDPGHHVIHELLTGRSAWLHVLQGEATLNDTVLTGGDGMGVSLEPSVSLTAQESTEILLVDLGPATCS